MSTLRKVVLFSLAVAFCFSFVSCDSGGSGQSAPEWAGKWEVIRFDEGQPPPNSPNYWDLSENELQIIEDSSGTDTQCKVRYGLEVLERDDNIVTFLGKTPNVDNQTYEFRFEVSEGTMTATVLESPEEENVGNEVTLNEIEEIPVNRKNCDIN